ncbi:MAG: type II toxin-antitoxin system death-on-curing family toxin [Verrucomicrobia bacterium]|nr:type II toxin-antitoxin system death-on-curing family toxin [Verrucomicrobiota bacterium]
MRTPVFLTQRQIEQLHYQTISRFGGHHGVRDKALWEAAIQHPIQVYLYTQGDLFDIASAYTYHIAQAQACLDGNKRTGIAAALLFLEINGISTNFDSLRLYDVMIAIAEKRATKETLAQLLRRLCC